MAKQHISWSIAAGCTGFVVGVWLALYWGAPSFLGFVGLAMVLSGFLYRRTWTLAVVAVGALLLGVVYGSTERGASSQVATLAGQSVSLIGTVREDPSTTGSGHTGLQLNFLRVGGYEVRGSVWASVGTTSDIKRGDRVELRGTAKEGFGNFLFSLPRASVKEVVRPVPGDVGRVVRDWFADAVRLGIAEPQASLGIGFLTGQKSALPEELSEQLRIVGLTHIVVASGYNLTILVRLARRLFKKHSLFLSTASSMAMIIGFIAVTGLSPSMTRAGLVSSLSLLAANYGRSIHPFVLLPFVAAISVAWQPSFAWGDLGWQLSMTAFAGVMVVAPLMQAYFFGPDPPGLLRQILGETTAAHMVTVPIIVTAFGTLSHVAIIANLMVVPLVPLAMLLTFIVGITGLAVPSIVAFIALPAEWLLTYMTSVAGFLADLPWAQSEAEGLAWITPVYIGLLITFCWYMQRRTGFKLREVNLVD